MDPLQPEATLPPPPPPTTTEELPGYNQLGSCGNWLAGGSFGAGEMETMTNRSFNGTCKEELVG